MLRDDLVKSDLLSEIVLLISGIVLGFVLLLILAAAVRDLAGTWQTELQAPATLSVDHPRV